MKLKHVVLPTKKTFFLNTNNLPGFCYRKGGLFFNRLLINDNVFIIRYHDNEIGKDSETQIVLLFKTFGGKITGFP